MSNIAAALPVSVLDVRIEDNVPILTIPADLPFDTLKEWLLEQVPARLDIIGGRTCRMDVGNRSLELFDLRRLLHLLTEEFEIDVSGLYTTSDAIRTFAERELKLKLWPTDSEEEPRFQEEEQEEQQVDEAEVHDTAEVESPLETTDRPQTDRPQTGPQIPVDPGRRTLNLHHTLRSGKVVRFEGDVVVFGDINPGAQVIAAGNIVVLGALKGMVHAGATGDEKSFVISLNLDPTQIRIGRKIAVLPDLVADAPSIDTKPPRPTELLANRLRTGASRWFNSDQEPKSINGPQIATVINGQIIIEPYQGKVFR